MKEFWNTRYAEPEYAYGEAPNVYFKDKLSELSPSSTILFIAEGEGRNAVHAAKMGHTVFATDYSESAKNKAIQLAQKHNVTIKYYVSDVLEFLEKNTTKFDAVVLTFAHFTNTVTQQVLEQLPQHMVHKGALIIEAFNANQVLKNYNSGGPKSLEMLCELNFLQTTLKDFQELEAYNTEYELNEGVYHKGLGSVVRYFGRLK